MAPHRDDLVVESQLEPSDRTPLLVGNNKNNNDRNGDIINRRHNSSSSLHDNQQDEPEAEPEQDASPPTAITPIRGLVIALMSGLLMFIQTTNISMITTTQSAIAADLDAFGETTWFMAAYMIAMSSLTPLGGRLSQIFSPGTLLLATSTIMSAGLFTTASAPTLPAFLLGRVVTGCGGAGIYSTTVILILALASKKRRGLFIGLSAACYTTGLATGAVLAGAVTPRFGWRLIYYIQAPLTLVAGLVIFLAIPDQAKKTTSEEEEHSFRQKLARIDYLGVLTLTTANILFLYSFASTSIPISLILLSVLIFGIFLFIEASPRLAAEPIIPLSVIRSRGVLLTCVAGIGLVMARWTVLFYTPVYAIAVRGWSPASAGLILVPTNAGFGLGGLLVGWAHIRKASSYYTSCLIIFILFSFSCLAIAFLSTPSSNVIAYIAGVFINGFCAGAFMVYSLSHVLHLTLPQTHFIVSSLVAMFRGFSGSFGAAIGGGIFSRVLKARLEEGFAGHHHTDDNHDVESLIRQLLGSPALVQQLTGFEKDVAVEAYECAIKTLFLAGFALSIIMTVGQAGTGWTAPTTSKRDGDEDGQSEGGDGIVAVEREVDGL